MRSAKQKKNAEDERLETLSVIAATNAETTNGYASVLAEISET
eukprot:CAMPEP_0194055220 /NCGR_PEP_ID=MMETSP0009_2-20130614/55973_1 /TAXON_ID=210454 /ORGANISM="Grammatophora oceanica, Strain CCMP 410" /LENGTH=42 /DNA_ID= /DNA_START= /DNA_END= /DNA_ORIENTATION=